MRSLPLLRLALATAAAAGTVSSTAAAATYHQWGCRTPSGTPAPADGWSLLSGPQAGLRSTCETGGAFGVIAGNSTGAAAVSVLYSPGPNLVATKAIFWRTAAASQSVRFNDPPNYFATAYFSYGNNQFNQSGGYAASESAYGDNNGTTSGAPIPTTLGVAGDPFNAANRIGYFDPAPADKPAAPFKMDAFCDRWTGQYDCDARYLLQAYDVSLRDDASPSADAVAGSLLADDETLPGASAPVGGPRTAIVLGSDAGSGIHRLVVEVDGAAVATGRASSAGAVNTCVPQTAADGLRAYLVRQPCPLVGSITATWDTATVSDGPHQLRLLLEDASGNQRVVKEGRIWVRNTPVTGPGSPPEFRGEPNGSIQTDSASISLVWPSTARRPSRNASTIRRCREQRYAERHAERCKGRAAVGDLRASWSRTRTVELSGRLLTPAGEPIADAEVVLAATPIAVAATEQPLATVRTGADGSFTAAVPLAAGSRTVQASWRARTGDTRPGATASATLSVRGATGLSAPRRAGRRSRCGSAARYAGSLRRCRQCRSCWRCATAAAGASSRTPPPTPKGRGASPSAVSPPSQARTWCAPRPG